MWYETFRTETAIINNNYWLSYIAVYIVVCSSLQCDEVYETNYYVHTSIPSIIIIAGGSVVGLAVGLCVLALFLIVVVVVLVVAGGSYRRSRQRRLLRTAPLVTNVHPPPPSVTTAVTHTIPPPEQSTASSSNYPAQQPQSLYKDHPPPYSAVAGTTDLGINVRLTACDNVSVSHYYRGKINM